MAKKPANLIYGVDDRPPIGICLLSRIMHRLRITFPPEVTGVVLTMVGLNIVPIMILDFMGVKDRNSPIETMNVLVGVLTLTVMVGTNVWSKGKLRLYSIIIGMVGGYGAAIFLGVLTPGEMRQVVEAPYCRYQTSLISIIPSTGPC